MSDEYAPLLGGNRHSSGHDSPSGAHEHEFPRDQHRQFCTLVGIPPSNAPKDSKLPEASHTSLYARAVNKHQAQRLTYAVTASLTNFLLLSQVVLGATLTALGAAAASHVLITLFGVLNTIIAGLVAYLKSRGQPMRARMYRDDLERVVAEIENSEIMWLGITKRAHGYDEIDIEDKVSVRSEVARLTRLYDRAVKSASQNNPEMYMASAGQDATTGLRVRTGGPLPPVAEALPPVADAGGVKAEVTPAAGAGAAAAVDGPAAVAPPVAQDPDESPATANPSKPDPKDKKNGVKEGDAKGKDAAK